MKWSDIRYKIIRREVCSLSDRAELGDALAVVQLQDQVVGGKVQSLSIENGLEYKYLIDLIELFLCSRLT